LGSVLTTFNPTLECMDCRVEILGTVRGVSYDTERF
jgi:hypothetical protein